MNQAVIFDMDGVLVDSEPVILAASIAGLSEFGVNAHPNDFKPFVGAGEDRFIGGVAKKYGVPYVLEMKKRVYEIYVEAVKENIKLYDGISEMLKTLKEKGFKIALASSADYIKIYANLEAANIPLNIFDAVVGGDDVVNKKPAPDLFLMAAEKLDVLPQNCTVIEDAVNGIMAAKTAGMKCIGITSSFSEAVLIDAGADTVCKNTPDILKVLF
jgi:HAD superfamily hydrolase (TIGR01509 family)